MGPEAAYWAVLTSAEVAPGSPLAGLIDGWLAAGNRSARELFELHPEMLAGALGSPVEALEPLLALRARLPRVQRLLDRLGRAGVDLLLRWDRRYPRALRGLADERGESVLWYAGSLDLLEQDPVAVAGPRDTGPDGRDFARAVAGAIASQGSAVLGGLAQTVERVAIEGALARERGGAIALLGQGIARAFPDLLRLQGEIRAGRLLVLSRLPLETAWHPAYEPERGRSTVGLMGRLVLAEAQSGDGSWGLAESALQASRVVLVRASGTEACRALLAQGAMPINWPAQSEEALASEALRPQDVRGRRGRESAHTDEAGRSKAPTAGQSTSEDGGMKTPETSSAGQPASEDGGMKPLAAPRPRRKDNARHSASPAAIGEHATRAGTGNGAAPAHPQEPMAAVGTAEIGIAAADAAHVPWSGVEADAMPTPGALLEAALLRYLQRHRRRVTSKGLLLQALPAEERALDQALTALIAAGQVAEHAHRTGVGYALAPQDGSREEGSNFQLSLFGQSEGTSTDETALADPAPVTDTVCLPLPQGDDLSW